MSSVSVEERVLGRVRSLPDYPQRGVTFRDITPVLADPLSFAAVVDAMVSAQTEPIDKVAGMEARGFLLAAPVAYQLGAGVIPLRKTGKLPSATLSREYTLEYGIETLEVHIDACQPGDRVLIVDDVLATGGTAGAAAHLIEQTGATVVGLAFMLEIDVLGGRKALHGRIVSTIVSY